jgi:hypothetical protein
LRRSIDESEVIACRHGLESEVVEKLLRFRQRFGLRELLNLCDIDFNSADTGFGDSFARRLEIESRSTGLMNADDHTLWSSRRGLSASALSQQGNGERQGRSCSEEFSTILGLHEHLPFEWREYSTLLQSRGENT